MVTGALPLPVYILAGGRSSRFGSDKARAAIGGKPLIAALAEELAPVASVITVVADRPGRYADLGLRTVGDRVPGQGPLGGLCAAIEDLSRDGWLALVACDLAGLRARWLEILAREVNDGTHCILFRHQQSEPVPALYHTSVLPIASARLAAGQRSLRGLLKAIQCTELDPPEGWSSAVNVNRREDLAAFLENRSEPHA